MGDDQIALALKGEWRMVSEGEMAWLALGRYKADEKGSRGTSLSKTVSMVSTVSFLAVQLAKNVSWTCLSLVR